MVYELVIKGQYSTETTVMVQDLESCPKFGEIIVGTDPITDDIRGFVVTGSRTVHTGCLVPVVRRILYVREMTNFDLAEMFSDGGSV